MKNKDIVSAVVGGMFFAVPYLGIGVALAPSLVIGGLAFSAGELVMSGIKPKLTLKNTNISLYKKLELAKKQNKEISLLIPKVESEYTKTNLKEIVASVDKIIKVVEKEPKKEKRLNNFFDYYLPVLIKIVSKYDEIENQRLVSNEGKNFLKKADKMIEEINKSFQMILSSLYQKDIMDVEADLKVYDMMLKADGIVEDSLMKGSDGDE
ncbi:MAG: 5-bromo-4-chloroindolyl phosphate hydrolysis family protein [Bacilli bacterium]|nr:5-bromo-4-chloroindolyl phosphate hydrolysis family protein [Bacilli bacterium]